METVVGISYACYTDVHLCLVQKCTNCGHCLARRSPLGSNAMHSASTHPPVVVYKTFMS